MSCQDCMRSQTDAHWHGYHDRCDGCQVRALAKSPRSVRQDAYDRQPGHEAQMRLKVRVAAEFQRLQDLKAKTACESSNEQNH